MKRPGWIAQKTARFSMQKSVDRVMSALRRYRAESRPKNHTTGISSRLCPKLEYALTSILDNPLISETAIHPSRKGLMK